MALEGKRQNAGNKAPVALPNSGPLPPSPSLPLDTVLSGVMGARVRVTTSPPSSSTYEGLLYTADPITSLIVLSTSTSSSSQRNNNPLATTKSKTPAAPVTKANTFTVLPISRLESFTILCLPTATTTTTNTNSTSPSASTNPNLPNPTPLSFPQLTSRLQSTITTLKQQDARRGRGVTREAQDIFDGIARTHPARWAGTSMLINENILIDSPYGVEDCRLVASRNQNNNSSSSSGNNNNNNSAVNNQNNGSVKGPGSGAEQGLLRIKKVLGMEREKLALRRGLGTTGLGIGIKGSSSASGTENGTSGRRGGATPTASTGAGLGERKGG